jgi:hypothetical protein
VSFLEGIINLCDHTIEFMCSIVAVIKADRVKNVTEVSRRGKQFNRVRGVNIFLVKIIMQLMFDRTGGNVYIITIMNRKDVPAVITEEFRGFCDVREFIQVQ